MLCLYLQAPFAVFRTFITGSFRPTAEFVTPSAAYGLLLNVAGIEMRADEQQLMTLIKRDLPRIQLAIGALSFPSQHSVYQQLHNYPVGDTGKEHAPDTKGNKYNITPVRRSFLSDIKAFICIDGDAQLESRIRMGLRGKSDRRYGLPFLGDNNFMIDRLEVVDKLSPAFWYELVTGYHDSGLIRHITRLTITIDRADMAMTRSELFAPTEVPSVKIPKKAWIEVGY